VALPLEPHDDFAAPGEGRAWLRRRRSVDDASVVDGQLPRRRALRAEGRERRVHEGGLVCDDALLVHGRARSSVGGMRHTASHVSRTLVCARARGSTHRADGPLVAL